jgi:hypothetical protein
MAKTAVSVVCLLRFLRKRTTIDRHFRKQLLLNNKFTIDSYRNRKTVNEQVARQRLEEHSGDIHQ